MRSLLLALLLSTCQIAIAQGSSLSIDDETEHLCHVFDRQDGGYHRCMRSEEDALASVQHIAKVIPDAAIRSCTRRSEERGDDYAKYSYVWMLGCLTDELDAMREDEMPLGSASLNRGGRERRYWSVADCEKDRKQGEVCRGH